MPVRPSRRAVLTAALSAVLPVAACSGGSTRGSSPASSPSGSVPGSASGSPSAAFPVTVEHAFGTTTVPAAPARVVTWGWGSTDAAIALGVVPVAMPRQTYGGDADGVLPWVRERLEADGTPLPSVLPDSQEAPVEAIAAAGPDLVLAPYSGLTRSEYDTLSRIAPVVAYPKEPWATPWRDVVRIVGRSLGRSADADRLLADLDARLAATAKAHPELAGRTVALVAPTPEQFYVYKGADPRVEFTVDLGMTVAPSVATLASGDQSFFYTLSTERLDELTSDVVVVFSESEQVKATFLRSPAAGLLPAARTGGLAHVVGQSRVAAVSPPTVLSLAWGLDPYVAALSAAAKASSAAG